MGLYTHSNFALFCIIFENVIMLLYVNILVFFSTLCISSHEFSQLPSEIGFFPIIETRVIV